MKTISTVLGLTIALLSTATYASPAADFSGTWVFNASKSKGVGMMASAQVTSTIKQTSETLIVIDDSIMGGQKQSHEIDYDLSGKQVANKSPMGENSQTTSKWSGSKLITTWTTEGAIAGTKVVRTETRYLSSDGKTMVLESRRGNNPPMVIEFDRK